MSWIDNLKQIMTDRKVNIEVLKERIESNGHSLSRNSISNILNGNNNPKIETLQVIAEALGVDISDILKSSKPVSNEFSCPNCGTRLKVSKE